MLSILIPTYNYVCAPLVCDLQKQCEEAQALLGNEFQYEIIVADDASTKADTVTKNAIIERLPHCRYEILKENVGRSAIRNWLVAQSQGEWLLFADADAEVINKEFILRYLETIRLYPKSEVVVGGILHPETCPSPEQSLRFRYEKAAEKRFTAQRRQQRSYFNFRTFNFLIKRNLCLRHPFDENVKEYGYEDVLFGMDLQTEGTSIVHIDNPLLNGDIEDNVTYLNKTELALRTLHKLEKRIGYFSPIVIIKRRLNRIPLILIIMRVIYKMCYPFLRRNLLSRHPNLNLFAFYKLGYYITLKDHQTTSESPR